MTTNNDRGTSGDRDSGVSPSAAPVRPAPGRRRKVLSRLLYLLYLVLFVELSLQIYYYATVGDFLFRRVGRPMFVENPHCGFWNKPDLSMVHNTSEFRTTIYTNRQGFRTSRAREEYSLTKPSDTFRILLLGPSFAFGWGVDHEQTFAVKLQQLLSGSRFGAGRAIEIINAGVPSLGADSQLQWYKHVGRKYSPDLVVQITYGSMDVSRSDIQNYAVTPTGYLIKKNTTFRRRVQGVLKQSALVFYTWVLSTRLSAGRDADSAGEILGAGRELTVHESFSAENEEVAASLDYYDELHARVIHGGARLLEVHVPLTYCVHPEDIGRWKHLGVRNIEGQNAYNRDFCHYLNRRGFECLNATPDLIRAAEAGRRQYYWLDVHWNPEGNETTAKAVADYLLATRKKKPTHKEVRLPLRPRGVRLR